MGPLSSYTAPALEKGLDILEHLATCPAPISMAQMAQQMGRTVPELYRMLQVLSDRGYVEAQDHGYVVTSRAFCLGLDRPDVGNLLMAATGEMERLSQATGQACWLSTADDSFVVAVAVQPSPNPFGLKVRVGMRQPLMDTAAGAVHFGFQPKARKDKWQAALADSEDAGRLAAFLKAADGAVRTRLVERRHRHVDCLTEIACAITAPNDRVFALSLLYLHQEDRADLMACRSELSQTARSITQAVGGQPAPGNRPDHPRYPAQAPEVCG